MGHDQVLAHCPGAPSVPRSPSCGSPILTVEHRAVRCDLEASAGEAADPCGTRCAMTLYLSTKPDWSPHGLCSRPDASHQLTADHFMPVVQPVCPVGCTAACTYWLTLLACQHYDHPVCFVHAAWPDDPSPIISRTAPCWLQARQSRSSRHDDAIASLMGLPAQQPADSGQVAAAHAEPSSSDQSAVSDEAS